ncbi:hypothetical protein FOCC_FOCC014298, partial [Frankliniella occidentalis]
MACERSKNNAKRRCLISTPESFRNFRGSTSTPINSKKNLFGIVFQVKAVNTPVPFLQTNFLNAVERGVQIKNVGTYSKKIKTVSKCVHQKDNWAVLDFETEKAMQDVLDLKEIKVGRTLVTFEPADNPFSDVYNDITAIGEVHQEDDIVMEVVKGMNATGLTEHSEEVGKDDDEPYVPSEESINSAAINSNSNQLIGQKYKVKVENLPPDFDVDYLQFKVECLLRSDMLLFKEGCISNVYDVGQTAAVVEFTDDDHAAALLEAKELLYSPHDGIKCLVKFVDYETPTKKADIVETQRKVSVLGLPSDFDVEYLTWKLNTYFQKAKLSGSEENCVSDVESEGKTVVVELTDERYASALLQAKKIQYKTSSIQFQECTTIKKTSFIDENTKKVTVLGLPSDFDIEYLEHKINLFMFQRKLSRENEKCVLNIEPGESATVVELTELCYSSALLKCKEFRYSQKHLLQFQDYEVCTKVASIENQNKLSVLGLPTDFDMEYLQHKINIFLSSNGVCKNGTECVKSCEATASPSEATIELTEELFAEALLNASSIPVGNIKVQVVKFKSHDGPVARSNSSSLNLSMSSTTSNVDMGRTSGGAMAKTVYRSDWTLYTEAVLLRSLLQNIDLFFSTSTQQKGKGFSNVKKELEGLGLYYSEKNLRKKIKSLPELPPAELKEAAASFKHSAVRNIVKGQISKLSDMIPRWKEMEQPAGTCTISPGRRVIADFIVVPDDFSPEDNSSKFETKSDKLLLAQYYALKPEFDDSKHRASEIYKKILGVMHKHGYYHLTVADLSRRMSSLGIEYRKKKDELRAKTGTGSEAL